MASLANQTISSTYDGLVKTSTDQPVPISGVQLLEDGVGNSLALSVGRANQGVTITGTLSATSISGVLADGVTATTQTSGDNSTKVATTAYVDAATPEVDLDLAGDSGTGTVDLATQSLTIEGTANEIETSASGQTITIGLPSSVTVGTLTATTLAGTLSTAAQTNITSVGTLSSLAVSGDVSIADKIVHTGDTNTAIRFPAADAVTVETAGSERLRIDSSGNALIGTTSSSLFASGVKLIPNGTGIFAASGANSLILNRLTSEGSIVEIRQASNVVGSINVSATGASIRLGGNAAANALDDYEEGTFNPRVSGNVDIGEGTYTLQSGVYVKIGKLVTVTMQCTWTAHTGSGSGIRIDGLPFVSSSTTGGQLQGGLFNVTFSANSHFVYAGVRSSSLQADCFQQAEGGGIFALIPFDTAGTYNLTGQYYVD
jgi:hypothetical protein